MPRFAGIAFLRASRPPRPTQDNGGGCSALADEAAADEPAMNLVRTLPNLGDLGVTHQPLDPVFRAIAVPAVQLHSFRGDPHRQVRGAHLEHRGLDRKIVSTAVDEARDVPKPSLAQRKIGGEVGEQKLDALKLDDAPTRLPALVDVEDSVLKRGAGDAERVGSQTRTRDLSRRRAAMAARSRVRREGWRGAPGNPPRRVRRWEEA